MTKTNRPTFRSEGDDRALRSFLDRSRTRVDRALERILPSEAREPVVIHRAMRYSALSEGKRLRPAMVILAYDACGGRGRRIDDVAAALEMVHAFSLIHDDLPAMDDDDLRRGQPSCHIAFGEGIAILAGDALLTLAFGVLGRLGEPRRFGPEIATRMMVELSAANGTDGVIGGQVMDLLSEGKRVPRSTVEYIHRQKTARLFMAALRLGAIAGRGTDSALRALTRYGEHLGIAFQIVDDILGAVGSFRELGRDPGRDRERGKATYPSVEGLVASHREVDRRLGLARRAVRSLPARQDLFGGLAGVVDRRRRDEHGRELGESS